MKPQRIAQCEAILATPGLGFAELGPGALGSGNPARDLRDLGQVGAYQRVMMVTRLAMTVFHER